MHPFSKKLSAVLPPVLLLSCNLLITACSNKNDSDTNGSDAGMSTTSGTTSGATTGSGTTGSGTTGSGTTGSGTTDSGTTGSGTTDSGTTGSGTTDSGTTGSGTTGSGTTDSGTTGSGTTGSGTTGSGTTGSGTTGSGTTDSGTTGSGTTGSGTTGSGTTDSGTTGSGTTGSSTTGSGSTQEDAKPVVRAPSDLQGFTDDNVQLSGSVSFQGEAQGAQYSEWTVVSGPGSMSFADSSKPSTIASFGSVGNYVLKLSAYNGSLNSSDSVKVNVIAPITNNPPVVSAGDNVSITLGSTVSLHGEVSDDGHPSGTLSTLWSQVSGPAEATIGEVSDALTTVTFDIKGDYVFQLEASDGELSLSDKMSVNVYEEAVVPDSDISADQQWQFVTTTDGSTVQARHEAGGMAYTGDFYLMGGRGIRQVNRYKPSANIWENLGSPSMELNHFQPVGFNGKIYVVGALDCCFPSESTLSNIQIFDPATKTWSVGAQIPANRRRGSAGTVVYNNKIYIVGGTTNGHDGGMVSWFDEYNPVTNEWNTLTDAPHARDHFSAVVVGNKLVAAGGRQTDYPNTFKNLVSAVDIYNFSTNKWESGSNIPTKRAGALVVAYEDEAIVIGGESDIGSAALATVEAFNVNTKTWRTLQSLKQGRHSGGAAIVGNAIHVVSGNTSTGGGNEVTSHEKLPLP